MFNFVVNSRWCEVRQYNELEFLDAMYYSDEEDQPEVEEPKLIV